MRPVACFAAVALAAALAHAQPLSTAFTFQGELDNAGAPAAGTYDFKFTLYDALTGGSQVGPQLCSDNVAVASGKVTVQLDFGSQFSGQQRFLEVWVRPDTGLACANPAGFTILGPRQSLTAAPNAVYSLSAASAINATQLNSQPASFYTNAANLSSGVLADSRLGGSYAAVLNLTNIGNSFVGSGAGLTSLNASSLASGTLADARLSSNVALLNASNTFTGAANNFQGNLGIGGLLPGWRFSVTGGMNVTDSSGQGIRLTSDDISLLNAASEDPVYRYAAGPEQHDFFIGGSSVLTIAPTGNVGIGTPTPSTRLHVVSGTTAVIGQGGQRGVQGNATGAVGGTYGVFGVSPSDLGAGVFGTATHATGATSGIFGTSASTAGTGVLGQATAATGPTAGVKGDSASPAGYGVWGTSATNIGVRGDATLVTGVSYGGRFQTTSHLGRGVFGLASSTTGNSYGMWGQTESPDGIGVYGLANADSGLPSGVYGEAHSPSGTGVRGLASASTGSGQGGSFDCYSTTGTGVVGFAFAMTGVNYGVYGATQSNSGRAVYGLATSNSGTTYGGRFEVDSTSGRAVLGLANATTAGTTPYGVLGQASTATNGFGVFANGDMGASGVKPFRIDHPMDPANKYLLHYAAESPEVLNIYSGKVTLNEQGEATIDLPPYFASINKDPRYTLTAIGAAMPLLHIADEISDEALKAGEAAAPGDSVPACSFRIAGGAPNAKVSWEVKALRNDLRVRLHGAPVERDKTGPERGHYQHPEYYGLPQELGMDDTARREPPRPLPAKISPRAEAAPE
jgi:hypothetical protein